MASKKGKIYEAIFMVALQDLTNTKKLKGKVFWNVKPSGMTIEPDFTIGPDKDNPSFLFLVTHSGSAKDSEKKFWRNMGELGEAKIRLPKAPKVYTVAFDGTIKVDLKALQEASFDGQLLIADSSAGKGLVAWVDKYQKLFSDDSPEKVNLIQMLRKDPTHTELTQGLKYLAKAVEGLMNQSRPELDSLWKAERARPIGKAPAMRPSYLRRGGGKLLLLDKYDQVDAKGKVDPKVPSNLKILLIELGLAKNSLGGCKIIDPEILWVVNNLSDKDRKIVHSAKSIQRVSELVGILKNLPMIPLQVEFLRKNWTQLNSGKGMYQFLGKCSKNPEGLCPGAIPLGSKQVWLFHLIFEWIKIFGGDRTSFGLAVMVDDIEKLSKIKIHQNEMESILGRKLAWQSKHTISRRLSDWYSAPAANAHELSDEDLVRTAYALALRLNKTTIPVPAKDSKIVRDAIRQTTLEAKLLTYRNFQPIQYLLEGALSKAGISSKIVKAMRAGFAEYAEQLGFSLGTLSSGTTVMRAKNTLINWQSAHDSHTNDKKKELCGRAAALRYTWDRKLKSFIPRPGVKKLILVVDGTWKQADLDALVYAGWDELYYPDEVDRLVASIV